MCLPRQWLWCIHCCLQSQEGCTGVESCQCWWGVRGCCLFPFVHQVTFSWILRELLLSSINEKQSISIEMKTRDVFGIWRCLLLNFNSWPVSVTSCIQLLRGGVREYWINFVILLLLTESRQTLGRILFKFSYSAFQKFSSCLLTFNQLATHVGV